MLINHPQLPASLTPFTRNYVLQQAAIATLAERARCEGLIRTQMQDLVRGGDWPPGTLDALARCMADVHAGTIPAAIPEPEKVEMRHAYRSALASVTGQGWQG